MCEYCTNQTGKLAIANKKHLGLSLSENKPNVYMWGKDDKGWDISENVNFRYCPMCGRELNKTE